MTRIAVLLIVIGLIAAPAAAQGRGRNGGRIPPGHMPSAGECRVWYNGIPPGRQPAPTSCAEAERIAARDGGALVIYGDDSRRGRNTGIWRDDDRDDDADDRRRDRIGNRDRRERIEDRERRRERIEDRDDRDRGRAVPRSRTIPRTGDRQRSDVFVGVAFDNGYKDGLTKGREDARDRDSFDPNRHSWYRSANRGYDTRHGTREQYAAAYRQGFRDGYDVAYRDNANTRRSGSWWPF